jgi:hypothetical protein
MFFIRPFSYPTYYLFGERIFQPFANKLYFEKVRFRLQKQTLDCNGVNRDKSSFKFENMWLKTDGFVDSV